MLELKTALICGKWKLPILEGEANTLPSGAKGYYEYINKRPAETGRNALCIEWLLQGLPKYTTVLEPFGGVGVFATIVRNMLRPTRHQIYDIDDDCLRQLRNAFTHPARRFNRGVTVAHADARYILRKRSARIYLLDFPFQTITLYLEWEEEWQAIFAKKPRAVIWMDGAARYMHFHKERYSARFGQVVNSQEDYARAMSRFMYERHGYSITKCAWSIGCFYFLAERTDVLKKNGELWEPEFYRVSSGAEGLKISDS